MAEQLTVAREGRGVLRVARGARFRRSKFGSSRTVDAAAKYLGVDSDWLQNCLDSGPGEYDVPSFPPSTNSPRKDERRPMEVDPLAVGVRVRGLTQKAETEREYPNLEACLADTGMGIAQPLITWEMTMEALCALDVDFHQMEEADRPTEEALNRLLSQITPVPSFAWITHGRGLRLVYYSREGLYAYELAAVAACKLKRLEDRASVELKAQTRHPLYVNEKGQRCGPVIKMTHPDADLSAVASWIDGVEGQPDPETVEAYLEANGYVLGQHYPHTKCPVNPCPGTHDTSVNVYEDGIMCFRCREDGIRRHSKAPGWFPFSVLCGEPVPSQLSICVDCFTHWEHARYILAGLFTLPPTVLRGAYGALLRKRHGDDRRIVAVFAAGKNIVRFQNRWGSLRGETFSSSHLDPILERLPACQFIGDDGKVRPDRAIIGRFLQAHEIELYGYPHLRPIWGCKVGSHFWPSRYPYEIVLHHAKGRKPRYIPLRERGRIESAWHRIEYAFPGVNRALIELLVAAKGCVERDGTWTPFIFISGVTGASKSVSVLLAAAIAGDTASEIPLISDDEKLRASITTAKERGTYCVFNEAVKSQGKRKVAKDESMEFALTLTSCSLSHKLYVGPVPLGVPPVCTWTDINIPAGMKRNAQVARRFVWVHLPHKVPDWTTTMTRTGMGRAENLRDCDVRYNEAADVILSDVIDRFFQSPRSFDQIARELGFTTLDQNPEATAQREMLQHFFELVWADTMTPREDGWIVLNPRSDSPLAKAWWDLADEPARLSSERCMEQDWNDILQAPKEWEVQLKTESAWNHVKLRFEGIHDVSCLRYRDPQQSGSGQGGSAEIHPRYLDPDDEPGDFIARANGQAGVASVGACLRVDGGGAGAVGGSGNGPA